MRCWRDYLSGARYKRYAYGPADADATSIISFFLIIQNGFTFLVPDYPGCCGKKVVKQSVIFKSHVHQINTSEPMAFEFWNCGGLDLSTAVRVCSPCLWLYIVLIVMVHRAGQGGTQSCDVWRRCHFHATTRSLWQIECKLYNRYIAVFRPAHVLLRPRSCSLRSTVCRLPSNKHGC